MYTVLSAILISALKFYCPEMYEKSLMHTLLGSLNIHEKQPIWKLAAALPYTHGLLESVT